MKFPTDWERIIASCKRNLKLAEQVSRVLASLLVDVDCADPPTVESTPACHNLFKGISSSDMKINLENNSKKISKLPCAFQRLYFLPPGQAGNK